MPLQKLREFLDVKRIKYTLLKHSPAYTAQELAERAHIPGEQVAKTVMAKLDGKLAMVVIPASHRVDFEALADATGAAQATLAEEFEFAGVFPGCEVGAMPPFGNLWKLPVYASEALLADDTISFNAGTHTELMTLAFNDFLRLVEPKLVAISKPR